MKYVQLAAGVYARTVDGSENIVWDANHFCRPDKLTPEEAATFQVFPLTLVTPPAFDRITQGLRQGNPVYDGAKWAQSWEVFDLSPQEVSDNQVAQAKALRAEQKAARALSVENIKVTTGAGHTFDGDETSQTRMARAIVAMQATGAPAITWVLADNTPVAVGVSELVEALALAGAAQAALWVIP